jgi:hypothetical protein
MEAASDGNLFRYFEPEARCPLMCRFSDACVKTPSTRADGKRSPESITNAVDSRFMSTRPKQQPIAHFCQFPEKGLIPAARPHAGNLEETPGTSS